MRYLALALAAFSLLNICSTLHAEQTKRYMITLKENSSALSKTSASRKLMIRNKAENHIEKSKIKNVFKYGPPGYSAELSPQEASLLRSNSDIASVEEVPMMTLHGLPKNSSYSMQTVSTPWHLDRIDQRNNTLDQSFEFLETGDGVHVYVLDSGIDNHSEFGLLKSSSPTNRIGTSHHLDEFNDINDCNGHGTAMASAVGGLLYGVAKETTIHPVRVVGCSSSFPTDNVTAGLEWVLDNLELPAVINLSLGGGNFRPRMNEIIQSLHNAGAVVIASAGNRATGLPGLDLCSNASYPASYDNVFVVGASNDVDQKLTESYFGACVDIFAPGQDVQVAQFSANGNTGSGFEVVSGTSPAAAYVSGLAALYLSKYPNRTPAQVEAAILNEATVGALSNIGTGSPNRLAFTNLQFDDPDADDAIESSVTEGFESNISWTNSGMFNWSRRSGTTPSGNTGPSSADGSNYYAYFETSSGHAYDQNDTAILVSDYFDRNSIEDIELSYHMYGADIGTLQVEIQNFGRDWKYVTSLAGQQQSSSSTSWRKTASFKPRYYGLSGLSRIRVIAKANGGYRGDIAIDNIKLIEPMTIPSRPTITSPTNSSSAVYTLTWTSVPGVDRYQWRRPPDTIWYSFGASPSLSTNLAPGPNTFHVRACNSAGCSPYDSRTITYSTSSSIDARNDYYTTFVPQCSNKSNTFTVRPLTNDVGSNLQISSTSNYSSEISSVVISSDRLLVTARDCSFSLSYTITNGNSTDTATISGQIEED